jgi:beta-mannosidase
VSDCLNLPLRQGSGGSRTLAGWEKLWLPLGEGEAERLPAGAGSGWEPAEVPGQLWASAGRESVWYRCSFARPDHDGRVLLRIGGAFLAANVWLNGRLLGSHYGYFAAFGFDLTSHLKPQNLLVICCESPVETDLARKRHVMGYFNDGDSRPYPSGAFFGLPEAYVWRVPIGLWRPVELEYTGPVMFDWLRLEPRLDADVGRLQVQARLRNLDAREMTGELVFDLPEAGGRVRQAFRLAGGVERTLSTTLSLAGARRWWPWRFGEPALYGATAWLETSAGDSARVEDAVGFRQVEVEAAPGRWSVRVNGQPIFLRGANYAPGIELDRLSPARFAEDITLAKEANLDALRVHAHVLPDEFYRQADAAGMLVIADFPLTSGYAYRAGAEEVRFFETAVREQVEEMVQMLANRPSILCWFAHDDPPWIAANAELGDVHAVRQNYTADQAAQALFARLDPGRAALAASGQYDSHVYLGWRQGGWSEIEAGKAGLVSEFGAQALPSKDSPVWQSIGRRWPVADDEPAWLHAGFESPAWSAHGVGLASDFENLETFIEASQRYQAWLVGFAVDQFRRHKFEPCWGAFVYQLVDPFPGIGFGLLDSERRPKLAYAALREAMAPVRLILEPTEYLPRLPSGIGFRFGDRACFRIIAVNDDPELKGRATVRWSVWRERAPLRSGMSRLVDAVRRKSYSGAMELDLPTCSEPAVQLANLALPLDAEGGYRLEAELRAGGRLLSRSELDFEISDRPVEERISRLVPPFYAERVADLESLRSDSAGLGFRLLNRARPAVLTSLGELRLDGRSLASAQVLVDAGSGRVPAPRRLELPLGRPIELMVQMDRPLDPGEHELELDIRIPGVAEGRLRIRGQVAPEELRPFS